MQAFHYPSALSCIKETYKSEGTRGFFRGAVPVLISVATLRSLAFGLYTTGKLHVRENLLKNGFTNTAQIIGISAACSGLVTGSIIACLNAPFEFIKLQRQLEKLNINNPIAKHHPPIFDIKKSQVRYQSTLSSSGNTSLWKWMSHTYKTKGFKTFFSGSHLHIMRDGLGTALYFSGYELMKYKMTPENQISGSSIHVIAGGIVGLVCCVVLFPIDLVKSVIQREALKPNPKYLNARDFIKRAWEKGGVKRFYAGIGPQLVRSFPVHALNFFVYEKMLKFCGADPI